MNEKKKENRMREEITTSSRKLLGDGDSCLLHSEKNAGKLYECLVSLKLAVQSVLLKL